MLRYNKTHNRQRSWPLTARQSGTNVLWRTVGSTPTPRSKSLEWIESKCYLDPKFDLAYSVRMEKLQQAVEERIRREMHTALRILDLSKEQEKGLLEDITKTQMLREMQYEIGLRKECDHSGCSCHDHFPKARTYEPWMEGCPKVRPVPRRVDAADDRPPPRRALAPESSGYFDEAMCRKYKLPAPSILSYEEYQLGLDLTAFGVSMFGEPGTSSQVDDDESSDPRMVPLIDLTQDEPVYLGDFQENTPLSDVMACSRTPFTDKEIKEQGERLKLSKKKYYSSWGPQLFLLKKTDVYPLNPAMVALPDPSGASQAEVESLRKVHEHYSNRYPYDMAVMEMLSGFERKPGQPLTYAQMKRDIRGILLPDEELIPFMLKKNPNISDTTRQLYFEFRQYGLEYHPRGDPKQRKTVLNKDNAEVFCRTFLDIFRNWDQF